MFAAVGTLIIINQFPKIALVIFIVLAIFSASFLLIVSKNRGQKIIRVIYERLLPRGIKNKTRNSFKQFYRSVPKKRQLIVPFIFTIMNWLVIYTQLFIVARAIGLDVPYFIMIFMFPIATIIAEIPISIGGLGIREASLIGLFGIFGVRANAIISMSIIGLIINNILPSLAGIMLVIKGYEVKQIKSKKTHSYKAKRKK
jgi:uncharacterized protein (TIRG00374 family)